MRSRELLGLIEAAAQSKPHEGETEADLAIMQEFIRIGRHPRRGSVDRKRPTAAKLERIAIEKAILSQAPASARIARAMSEPPRPLDLGLEPEPEFAGKPPRVMHPTSREAEASLMTTARQDELLMELSHDVLGFPFEQWQCSSPRNRAMPLPPALWPKLTVEKLEPDAFRKLCRDGVCSLVVQHW